MSFIKVAFIIGFLCFGSFSLTAQNTVTETTENVQLFTDKDKDFFQLWYYDQVLKMQLSEQGREDYLALLQYYTYKMTRLGYAKYEYTDKEQKAKFDSLVDSMEVEMKDLLSATNYKIHTESFKEIEDAVYKKKDWKK